MSIRNVAGVSWPRSGHHLVERLLQSYFGDEFSYCEFYAKHLDCCRTFPCARGRHFTKNHDFAGAAVPCDGTPYLVQYRAFAPAVISEFELQVFTGAPDTPDEFRDFAMRRVREWGRFVAKWVDGNPGERLIVRYEDLTARPADALASIVGFFGANPDMERIASVVEGASHQRVEGKVETWTDGAGVRTFRTVADFRFYSPALFSEIGEMADHCRHQATSTAASVVM